MVLFEGYNPLPFFWLMLLDDASIGLYEKQIEQARVLGALETDYDLTLNKLQAISMAANRRDYIKHYFLHLLPLFDDWLFYLQIVDFYEMMIYIDFRAAVCSYPNQTLFCNGLRKAVACFDDDKEPWYDDALPNTCGYAVKGNTPRNFDQLSEVYQELYRQELCGSFSEKIHLPKKTDRHAKWLLVVLLVLAILLLVSFWLLSVSKESLWLTSV